MKKCRISGQEMNEVFSLGDLCVSNFVPSDYPHPPVKSTLSLCFCDESKLLQLRDSFPTDVLYGQYWYRSGTNLSMKLALKDVVDSVLARAIIRKDKVWLDIASNDGTLLSYVPKDIFKVGIDPAEDNYHEEARKVCDDSIQDFFSAETYFGGKYGHKKAFIVTAVAVFYDLDNPGKFLEDVYSVMEDDGLFVIQMSYTPLMVNQLAFDNICHEHVCYYSLTSLKYVLEKKGFRIVDCELNDVNGGSFRVYVKKDKSPINTFRTAPYRDVANLRIQALLEYEENNGFNDVQKYISFYEEILKLKKATVELILTEYANGKKIWGYGASTKGNTLLQWYGLDNQVIEKIAERSPYKYGLKTVGTNIPICSEDEMREAHPDFLLILPWHFIEEFRRREQSYLQSGGAFIVPCPKLDVITG